MKYLIALIGRSSMYSFIWVMIRVTSGYGICSVHSVRTCSVEQIWIEWPVNTTCSCSHLELTHYHYFVYREPKWSSPESRNHRNVWTLSPTSRNLALLKSFTTDYFVLWGLVWCSWWAEELRPNYNSLLSARWLLGLTRRRSKRY